MLSLKKQSEKVLLLYVKFLHCANKEVRELNADKVWQYLLPAAPLLTNIVYSSNYESSSFLTMVFLPLLSNKGKLHITSLNIGDVIKYGRGHNEKGTLSYITHLKVEYVGTYYFTFLPTLGLLRNLRVFVTGAEVNDDMLSVVGINCPHLEVYDSREDNENFVTDVGLAYLGQCRKLKHIFFSTYADQYDTSEEQPRFTGKGVALLLMLPQIDHVLCSEYLLRDALHFMYQARYQDQSINIRCMLLDHVEVGASTLQVLPILCPGLQVLALRVDCGKEKTVARSLAILIELKMLVVTVESESNFRDLAFSTFGHQLSFLYITTYILDTQDLITLSLACTQLKTLVIKMLSFGFDGANLNQYKQPLFPTVEKLELLHNVSIRLFKYLNTNMQNLKELHCGHAKMHNLEEALNKVVEEDGWKKLEVLCLSIYCCLSLEVAKRLVDSFPTLYRLVLEVNVEYEQELIAYIQKNNPNLHWNLLPEASPSTSGCFMQDIWPMYAPVGVEPC